jgi:hypothetical protein
LGALFTKVICTFLKSVQKDGFFDAPFDLFKEKKFSSLRRDNELFWELKKVKNGRNRSKFRKTVFYKQILDFHCPSKILCYTSNLWNFVKITGPYCSPFQHLLKSQDPVLSLNSVNYGHLRPVGKSEIITFSAIG